MSGVEAAQKQAFYYSRIPLQALSYYFGTRQFKELQGRYRSRFGVIFTGISSRTARPAEV